MNREMTERNSWRDTNRFWNENYTNWWIIGGDGPGVVLGIGNRNEIEEQLMQKWVNSSEQEEPLIRRQMQLNFV